MGSLRTIHYRPAAGRDYCEALRAADPSAPKLTGRVYYATDIAKVTCPLCLAAVQMVLADRLETVREAQAANG